MQFWGVEVSLWAQNAAGAEILIQNLINSERPALAPHHPCISINNNKSKQQTNKQIKTNQVRERGGEKGYCSFSPPFHVLFKIWLKMEISSKFRNFVKIVKFGQHSEIWSIFWNLFKILKFGKNSEIWLKFWNWVKNLKFGQTFEIWSKICY